MGDGRKADVGDYKDLMSTTRALLRPSDPLADRDINPILKRIEFQNSGVSKGAWIVIEDARGKDSQNIFVLIDELSDRTCGLGIGMSTWKLIISPTVDKLVYQGGT